MNENDLSINMSRVITRMKETLEKKGRSSIYRAKNDQWNSNKMIREGSRQSLCVETNDALTWTPFMLHFDTSENGERAANEKAMEFLNLLAAGPNRLIEFEGIDDDGLPRALYSNKAVHEAIGNVTKSDLKKWGYRP